MSETENLICTRRFRALVGGKALYRGSTDSEASEEAEIRASGSHSGSEEAQGVPQSEAELFVPRPNGELDRDPCLGDGEVKGGQGEDGSRLMKWVKEMELESDGEESEKLGFGEGEQ